MHGSESSRVHELLNSKRALVCATDKYDSGMAKNVNGGLQAQAGQWIEVLCMRGEYGFGVHMSSKDEGCFPIEWVRKILMSTDGEFIIRHLGKIVGSRWSQPMLKPQLVKLYVRKIEAAKKNFESVRNPVGPQGDPLSDEELLKLFGIPKATTAGQLSPKKQSNSASNRASSSFSASTPGIVSPSRSPVKYTTHVSPISTKKAPVTQSLVSEPGISEATTLACGSRSPSSERSGSESKVKRMSKNPFAIFLSGSRADSSRSPIRSTSESVEPPRNPSVPGSISNGHIPAKPDALPRRRDPDKALSHAAADVAPACRNANGDLKVEKANDASDRCASVPCSLEGREQAKESSVRSVSVITSLSSLRTGTTHDKRWADLTSDDSDGDHELMRALNQFNDERVGMPSKEHTP